MEQDKRHGRRGAGSSGVGVREPGEDLRSQTGETYGVYLVGMVEVSW